MALGNQLEEALAEKMWSRENYEVDISVNTRQNRNDVLSYSVCLTAKYKGE